MAVREVHPGTIVFEDVDEGTSREVAAHTVPHGVAWVRVDGSDVAVVRVRSQRHGAARVIQSFSADGTLVSTTRQQVPQ